jgi:hypothetical protein
MSFVWDFELHIGSCRWKGRAKVKMTTLALKSSLAKLFSKTGGRSEQLVVEFARAAMLFALKMCAR